MSKRLTTEEFKQKAMKIHGDKYDYSKVNYINNHTKVCIICPVHGEFWQIPNNHICLKQGCPICANEIVHSKQRGTTETFIEKARRVHGDKYDYTRVNYIDSHTKVCIICPEHGEFWQVPNNHLSGLGCFKCGVYFRSRKQAFTKDYFIKVAKEIHGEKYDYSKVVYDNCDKKVCIICPDHGEFWQLPYSHIRQKQGCPKCINWKMENDISTFLERNNINFVVNKTFDWLKYKSQLKLDFYLPFYNLAIECQGKQHFENRLFFGGINEFNKRLERDKLKQELCSEHGIKILYYADYKYNFPYEVITDKNELLQKITSYKM